MNANPWDEIVRHVPVGIFQTDASGRCVFVNDAWCSMSGLTPEQAAGNGWVDALHPDDRAAVAQAWERAAKARAPFDAEYRFVDREGRVTWVLGRAAPFGDGTGFAGSVTSIHARKQAEELAHERESRFRDVANQAPVMIGVTDADGHITFLNRTWLEFRGKTLEEEEGWAWSAGLHPEDRDRACAEMEQRIQRRQPYSVEYRIQDRHGDYHWMLDTAIPRLNSTGDLLGYIGTAVMIDAQKRLEARLRRELGDKETLLREVHHRVKNNLQIVSSLTYFHSKKAENLPARRIFDELGERLRAMSLVHETLYQSQSLSAIDLGGYIRLLADALAPSLSGPSRIEIDVRSRHEVSSPLDCAFPVGLILSELMMNVGKYAFHEEKAGHCEIILDQEADVVSITVRDDGVGFPDGFLASRDGGFGWDLIHALVRQLEGRVDIRNEGGAEVTVRFPASVTHARE